MPTTDLARRTSTDVVPAAGTDLEPALKRTPGQVLHELDELPLALRIAFVGEMLALVWALIHGLTA